MASQAIPLSRSRPLTMPVAATSHNDDPLLPDAAASASPPIFIIDGHAFARDCLAAAFRSITPEREIMVFASAQDLIEAAPNSPAPSLILLCDHNTRLDRQRLEADLQLLTTRNRSAPVVLLCDIDDIQLINRAFETGTRGYIPSSLPLQVAIQAIEVVQAGGTYMPAELLVAMRKSDSTDAKRAIASSLTPRQFAVLEELRKGKANKVIALELAMRESTVKVHVRNIMRKLRARNRTEVTFLTQGLFPKPAAAS
jgi:DNA-binding NarL/FixJ family response regulator